MRLHRVIRCTSAVLGIRRPIASRSVVKLPVTMVGAGTGTRTPGLLITSNLNLSGVLSRPIAGGTRIARKRKRQSDQLSWRAVRRRGCPQGSAHHRLISSAGSGAALWRDVVRVVSGSVVAQRHDGAIAKRRHPPDVSATARSISSSTRRSCSPDAGTDRPPLVADARLRRHLVEGLGVQDRRCHRSRMHHHASARNSYSSRSAHSTGERRRHSAPRRQ